MGLHLAPLSGRFFTGTLHTPRISLHLPHTPRSVLPFLPVRLISLQDNGNSREAPQLNVQAPRLVLAVPLAPGLDVLRGDLGSGGAAVELDNRERVEDRAREPPGTTLRAVACAPGPKLAVACTRPVALGMADRTNGLCACVGEWANDGGMSRLLTPEMITTQKRADTQPVIA